MIPARNLGTDKENKKWVLNPGVLIVGSKKSAGKKTKPSGSIQAIPKDAGPGETALVRTRMQKLANPGQALFAQRFFKTGPGEYGEGDVFMGIRVPLLRELVREFKSIQLESIVLLLQSMMHEERLLALLLMVDRFSKSKKDEAQKARIYEAYLANTQWINNWDLVDSSAEHIVGRFLKDKDRAPLYGLVQSKHMWERRIGIMASFHFIRTGEFEETLRLAALLLGDKEDMIHKPTGWMLREIGKRKLDIELAFLNEHYKKMPRTMLRYAIERFPEALRQQYLQGQI